MRPKPAHISSHRHRRNAFEIRHARLHKLIHQSAQNFSTLILCQHLNVISRALLRKSIDSSSTHTHAQSSPTHSAYPLFGCLAITWDGLMPQLFAKAHFCFHLASSSIGLPPYQFHDTMAASLIAPTHSSYS